ncbi:MAG: hypothetical protein IKW08_02615 [Roseburia sp.]|nr:hypothetical protein [Roseburia sp.]
MMKSFYYRKLQENLGLIVWSLVMAIFCVLISYPGIFYSDSYARVETADKIRGAISLLLAGQRDAIEIRSWITVIPSCMMAVCKMITGNIASYTFLQAFAFFVISFLFIKRIGNSCKVLQYILFAINPLFYNEAIYYEAGVGCVVGMVMMVLILLSEETEKTKLDRVIEILLLIAASFVTFGYRANAFTILPVLLVYIFMKNQKMVKKVWTTVAIMVGFVLVLATPKVLNIDTMSSSMAGFVWEILTTIDNMEAEKKEEYIDYLDEFGKEGITERAVEANLEIIVSGFLEYSDLNIYALSQEGGAELALEKYIEFFMREPGALIETKWNNAMRTLGITNALSYFEYEYNCAERMGAYGFNDSIERLQFYRQYYAMINTIGNYILHPWIVFFVSIVLVVIEWLRDALNKKVYVFLLLLSVFYYVAYLLNTQSFELRYFYPVLYILWLMDLAIIVDILCKSIDKFKYKIMRKL